MADLQYSQIVKIAEVTHGADFSAFQGRRNYFGSLISPVLGFDHFKLKKDVFGAHRHVHMSALSYVFEDSVPYHNEDSMGTDLTITPGSLLWTWAGSGVVHHEVPAKEGEVHGLQLFLDIPPEKRALAPQSIYIPVETMPLVTTEGVTVKVVMGTFGNTVNTAVTPEPVTFLDARVGAGKSIDYVLPAGWNGTIYILSGSVQLNGTRDIKANEGVAFGAASADEKISIAVSADACLLLISGAPIAGH